MIERARRLAIEKPWGVPDIAPWGERNVDGSVIGELWYERAESSEPSPALRLKLLFTSQPLSIQVHPNDVYARQIGLANGKSEAWYVISAASGAKVALGIKERLTRHQVRRAVNDGTIAALVEWQAVGAGDVVCVPAGTIHAIGAGLVIAEIQQRSDATFRMFDHGRGRELHIDRAIAAASTGPAEMQARPIRPRPERTVLASNAHFVLERLDLPRETAWHLDAKRETWLLVLAGDGVAGSHSVTLGSAMFAQSDRVEVRAGASGMTVLWAYQGAIQLADRLQRFVPADTATVGLIHDKPVAAPATPESGQISSCATEPRS